MNVLTKANLDTSPNSTASLPKPTNSTNHYIPPEAYHLEASKFSFYVRNNAGVSHLTNQNQGNFFAQI